MKTFTQTGQFLKNQHVQVAPTTGGKQAQRTYRDTCETAEAGIFDRRVPQPAIIDKQGPLFVLNFAQQRQNNYGADIVRVQIIFTAQ